jgi:hypothetical protein
MGRCLLGLVVVLGACSARLADPETTTDAPTGSNVDAPGQTVDAPSGMLGPWGTPSKIPGADTAADEDDGTVSASGLELVFAVANAADASRKDLYVATRATTSAPFGTPTLLPFSVVGSSEETPRFSVNDKTLYFASDRAGGAGSLDIYKVTRQNATQPWGTPALVPGPNTAALEKWFMPCAMNGDYIVVQGGDLAAGTVNGPAPTVITELSSPQAETGTFLTSDCLTIYFASTRSGTNALYASHRTSTTTAWETPTAVIDFASTGGAQEDPWVAADGRTFVFASNASGSKDVYISVR